MSADRLAEVERLCHDALACPADARAAFIAEACGADEALRREVVSLLAEGEAAEAFLATPASPLAAAPAERRAGAWLSGRRLGPYVVEAPLATGGMGEVYRARDTKLGRAVAVKTLAPGAAAVPESVARFTREAHILAGLSHPAILTVHDVGAIDGVPFVVTELLDGETLREVLGRHPPSPRQALSLMWQVADGLAVVHRQGIVHRDIKPENLFLTVDGRMKVLDFGLATHGASSEAEASQVLELTASTPGAMRGTVAYMSPEQVAGQPVDSRSDVFAVGVVLYEMLAGHHPFRRDSLAATLHAILNDDPPRVAAVNAAVPSPASRIVARCLAKVASDRYADAHDLAVVLADVAAGSSGAALRQHDDSASPYPGLASFTERDAHVFVGREDDVAALWARIQLHPLVGIIGPSGAGKTSFVRAGVVPACPAGWAALVCTPGEAPLRSLGRVLASALSSDVDALRQLIAFDEPDVAVALVARWRRQHADVLLVIDQFEELFTLNPPATQSQVAVLLGRLVADAGVHLVVSLRDDFLMRCCEHAPLTPVLTQLAPLLPMGREALRRALVEPAVARGYRFDPESLVDDMIDEVAGARSTLPLLAFAVARLWERRDTEHRCLTRNAYLEIGGVAGALAQRADEVLARVGSEREPIVRELFRNLVTSHGTRAVIDRAELLSIVADTTVAESILGELVDARLLTSYEDAPDHLGIAHHRIEIAHESLITAWPRLVRWRTQDVEGAQLRDQLRQAAHQWDERGRMPDLLWTGTAYREYALWRERYTAPLSAVEMSFAAAMTERARRKRRLMALATLVAFAGLAAMAAYVAASRQRAIEAAGRSDASKLVAIGRLELDRFPTAAVAYARKSLEVADTVEARLLALDALWRGPVARTLGDLPCGTRLAFDPPAATLACSGFMPTILLLPRDGGATTRITIEPSMADTRETVFVDDGRLLLTWLSGDGQVRLLDRSGQQRASFPGEAHLVRALGDGAFVTCGAAPNGRDRLIRKWSWRNPSLPPVTLDVWTPRPGMRFDQPGVRPIDIDTTGQWMAFGSRSDVILRRLGDARGRERLLGRHAEHVRDVVFAPDADRLLSTDERGSFRVWSVPGGQLQATGTFPAMSRFSLAGFQRRGDVVAWISVGEGVNVWAPDGPPDVPPLVLRQPDSDYGGQVAFTGDGRWLASGSAGAVTLWPLALPYSRTLRGHAEGPIERLAFSPDGRLLASCARDGARLWSLEPGGRAQHRIDLGFDYMCYDVAFSPDSRRVAIASPFKGLYLVPVTGGTARLLLDYSARRIAPGGLAFDVRGNRVALGQNYVASNETMQTDVVDLRSGTVTSLSQRDGPTDDPYEGAAYDLAFARDGRLLVAGRRGVRAWTLPSTQPETLASSMMAAMSVSADGRRAAVVSGRSRSNDDAVIDDASVAVVEIGTGARHAIASPRALSHAVAIDVTGTRIVTADPSGALRVSSVNGGEPHLLVGHGGPVTDVAISPDGQWIASASASEIRLWPMPDLTKPPFHALPYGQLMQLLRSLTNYEVVSDAAAPTGYRLQVGPFPGWARVPAW